MNNNKKGFRYYNRRKDGKELEDCVTRAISTATGLKYNAVRNLLKLSARFYHCEELYVGCYNHLLENILCYPVYYCHNGEDVLDIAEAYPHDNIIIRIEGHCTCSIHGYIPDLWDCEGKLVDRYWVVDEE